MQRPIIKFYFDKFLYILLYACFISVLKYSYQIDVFGFPITEILLNSIALLFFVIFEVISMTIRKNKIQNVQTRMILIYPTVKRKDRINVKKLLLILLTGFLAFCQSYISSTTWMNTIYNIDSCLDFFSFAFTCCLMRLFFKIKLHRHHVLAFTMMFLVLLIQHLLDLNTVLAVFNYLFLISSSIWMGVLKIISFIAVASIKEVVEKYLMNNYFIALYRLLFYEGIIFACCNMVLVGLFFLSPDLMIFFVGYSFKPYLD